MSRGLAAQGLQVFERAAEVFSLLSTASRLRILDALCRGEMSVNGLAGAIDMPQPTVSQHLNQLFRAGLLVRRKEGVQVFYRVDPNAQDFLRRAIDSLVQERG